MSKDKATEVWEVGENYLIRTVTMINTGRLRYVGKKELVLTDAAWIGDTGRFGASLVSGDFEEVEMFPAGSCVIIGRGAVVDAVQIPRLPTQTK